jgi:predicted transglutaminase-like cysteine proteinase
MGSIFLMAVLGTVDPAASAAASMHDADLPAVPESALVALATARYGADAGLRVSAWETLIQEQAPRSEVERVRAVNTFVNEHVGYASDDALWRKPDYWASPLEALARGAGDCEDYTIAKYVTLLRAGVPARQLRITYVRADVRAYTTDVRENVANGVSGTGMQPHMVLAYYPRPDAEPLILDNLMPAVERASARADLRPVFGFNSEGIWINGVRSRADPAARISRWRDVLARMAEEGVL